MSKTRTCKLNNLDLAVKMTGAQRQSLPPGEGIGAYLTAISANERGFSSRSTFFD